MNFLQEMAQLGAEQAAAALSTMLGLQVRVTTLRAVQLTLPEISALEPTAADPDDFVGVHFTLHGEQPGSALVIFSEDDAGELVHAVRRQARTGPVLDELGMSHQ